MKTWKTNAKCTVRLILTWINFTKLVVMVCGHHGCGHHGCGRHCRTPVYFVAVLCCRAAGRTWKMNSESILTSWVPSALDSAVSRYCKLYCTFLDSIFHSLIGVLRPLSDTVLLWSGSSYRAFVYIGNDGFSSAADCKHNNRKDKYRFLSVAKEFKKWEHLNRLNSLIGTNVIAIVNKKREPHCVIWQMS